MTAPWLTALFLFLLAATACNPSQRCETSGDCFRGEVCGTDGFCGLSGGGDDGGNGGDGDAGRIPDSGPTSSDDATSPAPDASTPDESDTAGAQDAGNDLDAADDELGACYADPFVTCMDDENSNNNSFPGETVSPMTRGCQSSGFVPMDLTINGVMCPLDPMDMYGFNFVECDADEPGFVIEAILDVLDGCDPEDVLFDVNGLGSCDAPTDRLRCTTLADGRRSIQILMPGDSNPVVGGVRFVVETPEEADLRFDYTLQLIVRQ